MSFSLLKLYQQPIKLQVSIEVRREKQMGIKEKEGGNYGKEIKNNFNGKI